MAVLNYQNKDDARRETSPLRKLFGPSQAEIWKILAEQVGGRFEGGFWTGPKVQVDVGQWTFTLDRYVVSTGKSTVVYTRMRAPYVNRDGFRFTIYRKSIFSELGKMLGMQDITTGFPEFDEPFIVKAGNPVQVRRLCSNPRLRNLIASQPKIHLQVRDDEGWFAQRFPEGVDELYFLALGVIKDLHLLRGLFDLFAETLNTLCHIGSAYENDPGLVL